MLGVAPILLSRDLQATSTFLWDDEYLIVMRGEVGLHFVCAPGLDPYSSASACYLYVEDADALHAEYAALDLPAEGIPRLHGAPVDTDYGLREFAVVDPDGNLLRIGSFLAEQR